VILVTFATNDEPYSQDREHTQREREREREGGEREREGERETAKRAEWKERHV